MAYQGAQQLVERLVEESPEKAVDILVRYYHQDANIHEEIKAYLLHHRPSRNAHPGPLSPPNSFNITLGRPHPTPSIDSHHSASPPPRQRLPHRASTSSARPFTGAPLSPPSTVSSVTSRSSKGEAVAGEYVILLTFTEGSVKEHIVRMRTAPIAHSLMREEVVHRRNLTASLVPAEECGVFLPYPAGSHAQKEVPVTYCAKLEWFRSGSNSTHSTTFYIVPREMQHMLDVDVLLGYKDSGEGASEFQPPVAPQPQRPQGYVFEEYAQSVRPQAPTPPAASASYHRSNRYDRSSCSTPVQQPQPQHFVETLMARQQAQGAAVEASRLSQHSPASTALRSRASHIDHPQQSRPSASGHNVDHKTGVSKLRLSFEWGVTPMAIWLDLRAPGETFYNAFHQLVEKRKGIFERAMMTIYLKKDKQMPDDEAYPLSLDADNLEADWDTTVAWLEVNRRDKPPHVYGRVEAGEG